MAEWRHTPLAWEILAKEFQFSTALGKGNGLQTNKK
jgi:hypothetical protein